MIHTALQFIVTSMDQFFQNRIGTAGNYVVMDKLINFDGSVIATNHNKLIISLVNLERETAQPFYNRLPQSANQVQAQINPEVRLNADILIASNFDDYKETLTFLNLAISFFQSYTVLDSSVSANFPPELSRLEFEMERISYQNMHSLWTSMGVKYLPSVMYKMRMLTIQGNETKGFVQPISQQNTTLD